MLIKKYIILILGIFLSNYLISMDIEKDNQNTKSELLELSNEMFIEIIRNVMISYINNWNVISKFDHEVNVENLIKDLNSLKLVSKKLNNKLSSTEISNLFQKIRCGRFLYLFKKLKEKLSSEQPNINELNSRLNSIINEVELDPEEVIQLLIAGADLNLKDQNDNTILRKAIIKGSKELIEVIKELGFNVISDLDETLNLTPLMIASILGHQNIVSMLLKLGADVNAKDIYKGTALICACKRGYYNIVKLLIDHKADLDHMGDTAIYDEIIDGNYSSYKRSALIWACIHDHLEIVKLLVESKADINIQDELGNTALISSLKYGRKAIADFLIEKDADLNIKNFKNETTLMIASYQGYDDIVRLCIQNDMDVNEQDLFYKKSALMLACKAFPNNVNYVNIVKMLLEAGADFTDLRSLKIALYGDNIDIINILIKAGAKIEDTEFNDLIYVLENCKYKVTVFLIYNYFKAKLNAYNICKIVKQIKRT